MNRVEVMKEANDVEQQTLLWYTMSQNNSGRILH